MKTVSILGFTLLVACSSTTQAPVIDEGATRRVLDHHFETFRGNDLEGVMTDYTEQSILITPDGTYKGLSEIRSNFVNVFKAMPSNGTTIAFNKTQVVRDIAYVVWEATTPVVHFQYATDTFVIVDGKIVSQTFAGEVVRVDSAGMDR